MHTEGKMAKKKKGFVRVTVSVPVEVRERMKKKKANWSAIATEAFDKVAKSPAASAWDKMVHDSLERAFGKIEKIVEERKKELPPKKE